MLTAPYADYYSRMLALAGASAADIDAATTGLQYRGLIESRLRAAWQHFWWPDTMLTPELRAYRDDYDPATAYAEGDEVYYPITGRYYTALGATTGNVPTNATYWEELTELDPTEVAYEQPGRTAFAMVRSMSIEDPASSSRLRRLPFLLTATGARLIGETVPRTCYLWAQLRAPELRGDDYSAVATYSVGDRIYFASGSGNFRGDFWTCATATSAGENPSTHVAKWTRVELPRMLLEATAQGAAADAFRAAGKWELAGTAEARAQAALEREMSILLGAQGQGQGAVRHQMTSGLPVPSY